MSATVRLTLVVPLVVTFDLDRATVKRERAVVLDEIVKWLEDYMTIDIDTEDGGNPFDFGSAEVDWDEVVPYEGSERPLPLYPCRDGQLLNYALCGVGGDVVETGEAVDVNHAAEKIKRFIVLHGGDPDLAGKFAQPGTVTFVPVRKEG